VDAPQNVGNIRPIGIIDQMQTAYLDYSMSVIVSRALPDVRDGLKPVHRRVLYAMERMGLQANRSFRKCAGIVGEVLKDFHPHGDASVYDALVRMAQPWNMRYPLVSGQGNFGSPDDDPAAAMRYCVTGDTLVVTDAGLVPIRELSPSGSEDIGTRVLSKDGVTNTASKWWDCGAFPTFRVRTRRGYEVTGTANHPLLVAVPDPMTGRITLSWKTIDTIATGDYVVLDRSQALWPDTPVDLGALHPHFAETSRVERHTLPTQLDEKLAFLMGALLAEGTFRDQVIEFTNTEGDFADEFVQTWQQVFPTCRLHIFRRASVSYGQKPFLQMQVVSRQVITFLRALGLTGRSAERRLPALILRSPKSVAAAFLSGFFEGDGAVERSGRSELRIGLWARNLNLLQHIQILLLRFGIAASLYSDTEQRMHRLCISGLSNLSTFAEEIGFVSATKRDALTTIIGVHNGQALSKSDYIPFLAAYVREHALRGQREWLSHHNFDRTDRLVATLPRLEKALAPMDYEFIEQLAQQRYLFEQVVSIEDAGMQPVYSVRVDSACHSFVANGFVNHNTEARMAAIAAELLADIEKDTVDFKPNYDGHEMEPTVLPARLPNLLLNGAAGIAVGMATNIPPHNLRELCDGITHLIDNPDATVEELIRFVKAPDFPTGGIIHGREGIRSAYLTGRGRIVVRARANTEETDRGKVSIVVTELPYQVNKAELVKKIAELARDKKIEGISDIRDESDRQGTRVVIDLKKDTRHLTVLNQLFKYTAMQTAFNANMLALVEGQPRVLNLKAILHHYIAYREIVIQRRTAFDLRKARERAHILEGLQIALDHLDEVIETIRRSQSTETASRNLQDRFKLSEEQARAILDMRLGRLAALERKKVADELKEVHVAIKRLEAILADVGEVRKLIKADLTELREKYGDPRRTEIQEDEAGEFTEEDLIPNDEMVVTLTEQNYIKRLPSKTYRAQRRGGKGVTGMTTREDDTVLHLLITHAHDALLFFTNRGRVFQLATYELPEVGRQAKGEHIRNLIGIDTSERVTAVVPVPKFQALDFLIMATRLGEVKKTALDEFAVVRRMGLNAMDLEEGDELIGARLVHANDTVFLVTTHGQSIRFSVGDLRSASRASGGVRGIRLEDGDSVVTLDVAQKGGELLVVTAHGYGKRTPVEEYTTQGRGGSGILTARLTDKTGLIAGARVLTEQDRDLVLISANGVVIRSPIATIAQLSRATQGVRLMNMSESDQVSALATTIDEEDDDEAEAVADGSGNGATGK
jgi:DNA gyrase subunit A